jgi:hypothetical protein
MSNESISNRALVAVEIQKALMNGCITDVGVHVEGVQVWLAMLEIERNGRKWRVWFKGPQDVSEVV